MMGSLESEKDSYDEETQHKVTLTNPYYMGKYTVTQKQWKVLMGNNPSDTKGGKFPVTDVSWEVSSNRCIMGSLPRFYQEVE